MSKRRDMFWIYMALIVGFWIVMIVSAWGARNMPVIP